MRGRGGWKQVGVRKEGCERGCGEKKGRSEEDGNGKGIVDGKREGGVV